MKEILKNCYTQGQRGECLKWKESHEIFLEEKKSKYF